MPKTSIDNILKKEKYLSIVNLLQTYKTGLEFKHFRFILIGPEKLSQNNINKIEKDLDNNYVHIDKVSIGYFKKYKNSVSSLEKALGTLKKYKIITHQGKKYYLFDDKYFDKVISEIDKKNINKTVNNINKEIGVISERGTGMHIYGYLNYQNKYHENTDFKEYLDNLLEKGYKKINEGTKIINKINLSIYSLIKIKIWKEVIKYLEDKNISIRDREILLTFFITTLHHPTIANYYLKTWFKTDKGGNWFEKSEFSKRCKVTSTGEIEHPPRQLYIKKPPSKTLKQSINRLNPIKKDGEIDTLLRENVDINNKISYIIVSLALLNNLQKEIGNLFIISYPPTYEFFEIPLENDIYLNLRISNELGLNDSYDVNDPNLKKYSGLDKLSDELLNSFGPMGEDIKQYYKQRLIKGGKKSQWEKTFREILKKESKNFNPFSLILKAKTTEDIVRILKPRE